MTVKKKKEKTDKCTEKWCEGKVEREVKAYEWLHYSRREEKLFIYEVYITTCKTFIRQ